MLSPQEFRMMGVLERQAAAYWTYVALAWAAQLRRDAAGALAALGCILKAQAEMSECVYSGAYLKGRPLGIHTKRESIDDFAAHIRMIEIAHVTGQRRGETLAKAVLAEGLGSGASDTADMKRLAKWWNAKPKK
jgi:hypothetical protein